MQYQCSSERSWSDWVSLVPFGSAGIGLVSPHACLAWMSLPRAWPGCLLRPGLDVASCAPVCCMP
eukprot:15432360-Alexandrium_andersonii.AAC.1